MFKNLIVVICRDGRKQREFYLPSASYLRRMLTKVRYDDASELAEKAFEVADEVLEQLFGDDTATLLRTDCLVMGEEMLVVAYKAERQPDLMYFVNQEGGWLPLDRCPDMLRKYVNPVLERARSRHVARRARRRQG